MASGALKLFFYACLLITSLKTATLYGAPLPHAFNKTPLLVASELPQSEQTKTLIQLKRALLFSKASPFYFKILNSEKKSLHDLFSEENYASFLKRAATYYFPSKLDELKTISKDLVASPLNEDELTQFIFFAIDYPQLIPLHHAISALHFSSERDEDILFEAIDHHKYLSQPKRRKSFLTVRSYQLIEERLLNLVQPLNDQNLKRIQNTFLPLYLNAIDAFTDQYFIMQRLYQALSETNGINLYFKDFKDKIFWYQAFTRSPYYQSWKNEFLQKIEKLSFFVQELAQEHTHHNLEILLFGSPHEIDSFLFFNLTYQIKDLTILSPALLQKIAMGIAQQNDSYLRKLYLESLLRIKIIESDLAELQPLIYNLLYHSPRSSEKNEVISQYVTLIQIAERHFPDDKKIQKIITQALGSKHHTIRQSAINYFSHNPPVDEEIKLLIWEKSDRFDLGFLLLLEKYQLTSKWYKQTMSPFVDCALLIKNILKKFK